jgi:hypothetical protein
VQIDYFKTIFVMKTDFLKSIGFFTLLVVIVSCSRVNINDEQAVMKDIQGTWIGREYIGGLIRHIKVNIKENTFEGWLQTSDSDNEPSWTVLPTESGTFSLSSVLENPNKAGKFRKFSFVINGRCCGDNSLTAKTLSQLIAYMDGKGLYIAQRAAEASQVSCFNSSSE